MNPESESTTPNEPTDLEKARAERDLEIAQALLASTPINKSRATRLLREALGPQARFWERNGRVLCGVQKGPVRIICGEGADYIGALANAALTAGQWAAAEKNYE